MKKLFWLSGVFVSAVAFTGVAVADELLDRVYPQSEDVYNLSDEVKQSSPQGIIAWGQADEAQKVWSFEYEEYVNRSSFESATQLADINTMLEQNPTASGGRQSKDIFNTEGAGGETQIVH